MDRALLAPLGLAILLAPLTFGTVVGIDAGSTTLRVAGTTTETPDSAEVVHAADLPRRARTVARRLVAGESVAARTYALSAFGERVGGATVTDGDVRPGVERWPDRLARVTYLEADGRYHRLSTRRRETQVLRHLIADRPGLVLPGFALPGIALVYLGLRPDVG